MSGRHPAADTAPAPAASCPRCVDPLAVTLHDPPCRRVNHEVLIFRCPECGTLILDDIVGFKGHGTVFRASEAEIAAYLAAPPGRPWPIVRPALDLDS